MAVSNLYEKWRDIWRRFSGKGVYPHELAFVLDTPLRNLILPAGRLADRLHLSRDARVLEIGPGPGYFSAEVAGRVPEGAVVLLDIQREMLVKSRAKLLRKGAGNFRLVQGSAETLPFGDDTFDVVFMVTVLGEVPCPETCLGDIARVLRRGGLLSITEQNGDPDALSEAGLRQMGQGVGLRWAERTTFRGGFTLNMKRT